jgi:dimethylamine/trimethylamine dehydrogenase
VLDLEGYFTGAGMAEKLRADGYEVDLVTCFDVVAPHCDQTLEGYRLRARLHELGIGMHRGVLPTAVSADGLAGQAEFGRSLELAADAVVLVTQRRSDDALHRALVDDPGGLESHGVEGVFAIGDCVAPRLIADAIFDGHRLGREIDSADPARALPYRRERPLIPAIAPAAARAAR